VLHPPQSNGVKKLMRAAVDTPRPTQDEAAWDLFVFRKARESLASEALKQQLLAALGPALAENHQDGLLNCLIRAGELECALADVSSPDLGMAAKAVDALAAATLQPEFGHPARDVRTSFENLRLPPAISVSHAEGFSYYGLHPLDFWDLAQQLKINSPSVAVIGIRSIGTTLSSIVTRALQCRGYSTERISVRPCGPPYQRRLEFTPQQVHWVGQHRALGSEFLIVDEGPGFSGSSFAAVGRALRQAGVPNSRILFMGSRHPESAELQARFDPEWSSFHFCAVVQGTRIPAAARVYCSGGYWRQSRFARVQDWPACWTQLERNKYLSQDGGSLFKFEGFGRYGKSVYQRAHELAGAGFAPAVLGCNNGFVQYATSPGRPLAADDCDETILTRLAQYCAHRVLTKPAAAPGPVSLESMVAHNLKVEFGLEESVLPLPLEKPIVTDSRMMPHEWIAGEQLLKTDGASHGDDHLFPGPTDIAWDLAGVIAEWDLDRGQQEFFLNEYHRRSGDNPRLRLPPYLLAYSVFRMAFCRMGAAAMAAWDECYRLERQYHKHRGRVISLLDLPPSRYAGARLLPGWPRQQAA